MITTDIMGKSHDDHKGYLKAKIEARVHGGLVWFAEVLSMRGVLYSQMFHHCQSRVHEVRGQIARSQLHRKKERA